MKVDAIDCTQGREEEVMNSFVAGMKEGNKELIGG